MVYDNILSSIQNASAETVPLRGKATFDCARGTGLARASDGKEPPGTPQTLQLTSCEDCAWDVCNSSSADLCSNREAREHDDGVERSQLYVDTADKRLESGGFGRLFPVRMQNLRCYEAQLSAHGRSGRWVS